MITTSQHIALNKLTHNKDREKTLKGSKDRTLAPDFSTVTMEVTIRGNEEPRGRSLKCGEKKIVRGKLRIF